MSEMHIGKIIKKTAKQKGLNATTLAPLLSIAPGTVSNLFKREFVHTRLLAQLCQTLNYDFFSHLCSCPKNNIDSAQKISLLEKENEQLKTENSYLKEIVRLKGK